MAQDPFSSGLTMLRGELTLRDAQGASVAFKRTRRIRFTPGASARSLWAEIFGECGGEAGFRAMLSERNASSGVFGVFGYIFDEEDIYRVMRLPADVRQLFEEAGVVVEHDIDMLSDPGAFYEMLHED